MKINGKDVKEMFGEFFLKVWRFSLAKYLLEKRERNLQTSIKLKKGLIEHWRQQIIIDTAHIGLAESEIERLNEEIKELEDNAKKVVKVINLYID